MTTSRSGVTGCSLGSPRGARERHGRGPASARRRGVGCERDVNNVCCLSNTSRTMTRMSAFRHAEQPSSGTRPCEPGRPVTADALDLRLAAACAIAREAGKAALAHFRNRPAALRLDFKGHQDYLAATDAEVEALIRRASRRSVPGRHLLRRGERRRVERPGLDRRPDRRHRQFHARHPGLLHLDRLRAGRPDGGRRHLRSAYATSCSRRRGAGARPATARRCG